MPELSDPTMTDKKGSACAGSGQKPSRKGSKYTYYGYKYLCPICEKHFGTDANGLLNKHGYKITRQEKLRRARKAGKAISVCAECGKFIDGVDYLCETCRGD